MKKQISERCYNSKQSWYYVWIGEIDGRKYKVEIRRNAYDFQSSARAFVYDPEKSKWNLIVDAPIEECACKAVSYVQTGVTSAAFAADRDRLLIEITAICD